jgi:hypothetical protein
VISRFLALLRRSFLRLKDPQSVPGIVAVVALVVVLAWSGWFRALRQATFASAIVMVLLLALALFAALALWPSVSHLFSQLLYGDPYWIKPREFDIDDDPGKTEALTKRLAPIEVDADATLWRDQESGQYWISRRFDFGGSASGHPVAGHAESVRFKPLASRAHWRGMADTDWNIGE